MAFRDRPQSIWAFPLIALAVALALLGSDWSGLASGLRGALFDAYQRAKPRDYQDAQVRVLEVDPDSIRKHGAWPWSHAVIARVVGELYAQGAKMVVLDLPLDKTDPASPARLAADIPVGPEFDRARAAVQALPSPDTALATAITQMPTVTGFELGASGASFMPRKTIRFTGPDNLFARTKLFQSASPPLPPLLAASIGTGATNLIADSDGVLRRVPLVFRLRGAPVASLDAEALRVAKNGRRLTFQASEGGELFTGDKGVASLDGYGHVLPTAPDGSLWIAFARDTDARKVSASALDQNRVAPGTLRNAVVYIGAPDKFTMTPMGSRTQTSVHAEALEDMLLGTVLRRPQAANSAELAFLALCGLAMIFLLARFSVWWAGLFGVGAIAGAGAVSWQLFAANHVLLDALGPGLG
ncbi:MAG TPA: CHASE2 domain-containing protein, partial [Rhizomicrobium sp.]|nr:CHASE2 domain-containing protein [Rhizomicrobium sp.]